MRPGACAIRSVFFQGGNEAKLVLAVGEEILSAEHEGNDWWVYIARPVSMQEVLPASRSEVIEPEEGTR